MKIAVSVSETKIRFATPEITLTSKVIDGTFPDYTRVIPQGNTRKMEVDASDFAQAVDRVATVSSERSRAVKLQLDEDRLILSVNAPDSGAAEEELAVAYGDERLEIGFNAKYLLEIASQVDRENAVFLFNSSGDPTLMREGNDMSAVYVVMPMRRAVIDCDARPVAIYGPNGAGKTNILEAVSLMSPGRGLRRSSAEDMTRRPEALGWKITGILQSLHQVHELEIWSEAGAARQTRIDGKASPQTALGRIARVLWLIPSMDRLWIEGAEGRRRFLDRMTLSFLPDHAEHALAYEKAMRERNRLLKDMVREPSWYAALEMRMAEAGTAIHAGRLQALEAIEKAQEQAQTAFPAARLSLHCEMPAEAQDDAHPPSQTTAHVILRLGGTLIGPTSAEGAACLADPCQLPAPLAADFGAPPLLLLDEVAAHLDADRQGRSYMTRFAGLALQGVDDRHMALKCSLHWDRIAQHFWK
ncbi:DNA replication and repair protein RecF [Nymphon striatum]|nr:DNA replication and repair protein RecF [Nymphon striatum]